MFAIAKYVLPLALPLLVTGEAAAAGNSDFSGAFTSSIVRKLAAPLDAHGHVIVVQVLQGTNKNTGRRDFMDGAQLLFSETLSLDKGNGPETGVITFVKNGTSESYPYSGSVKTLIVDGKPRTSAVGTWHSMPGDTMAGSGTYQWAATSETDLTGEWKGHLQRNASER